MGKDLAEAYPQVRQAFDTAKETLDRDIFDLCLNGPEQELNDTKNTQLCIYTLSCGVFSALDETDIKPQMVAGHSLGEYSALTAAKVFRYTDGLQIVARRAELMSAEGKNRPGKMLAVLGADMRAVDDVVADLRKKGTVAVANYNCPGQIVISADADLADVALGALQAVGAKKIVALPVSGAFHSELMAAAESRFNEFLNGFVFLGAQVPIVSNTLAQPIVDAKEIKKALSRQMSSPVKWQQSIEQVIALGIRTFVEVGPGQVLSKLIKRIDKNVEVLATETPELLSKAIERLK